MTNPNGGTNPVPPPAYPPQSPPGQYWPQPGYPPHPPPPPPYPSQPVRPAKSRWPWIVGAIVAVVLLVAAGGVVVLRGLGSDGPAQTVAVTYEVTGGPDSLRVQYHESDGNLSRPLDVTPPWQTQVTLREEAENVLYVRAERTASSGEALGCRITSNGKPVSEDQSAGRFVFCSARIGNE